jgi:hypothetical protein
MHCDVGTDSWAEAGPGSDLQGNSLAANDEGIAAELMWRINHNGKAQALLDIVDKLQVDDPGAIDHLVEIMRPVSPAIAVQLTNRQPAVELPYRGTCHDRHPDRRRRDVAAGARGQQLPEVPSKVRTRRVTKHG